MTNKSETQPLSEYGQAHEKVWSERDLRLLGAACIARTVNEFVLQKHEALLPNPNSYAGTSMFSAGEIETEDDKVYRQVHLVAIQDLADTGLVRNGATARDEESRRWGHKVFWNGGQVINILDQADSDNNDEPIPGAA